SFVTFDERFAFRIIQAYDILEGSTFSDAGLKCLAVCLLYCKPSGQIFHSALFNFQCVIIRLFRLCTNLSREPVVPRLDFSYTAYLYNVRTQSNNHIARLVFSLISALMSFLSPSALSASSSGITIFSADVRSVILFSPKRLIRGPTCVSMFCTRNKGTDNRFLIHIPLCILISSSSTS